MFERIMGVFKLDKATFADVEQDQTATTQAAMVVVLVAILAGIGAAIGAVMFNRTMPGVIESLESSLGDTFNSVLAPQMSPIGAFINAALGAVVAWLIWSALTYFVGTKLFNGTADMGEMMRVIGFAQAPRLLSVLGFIPCLGPLLSFAGWVWALAASFVGIREGLDLDSGKTLLTILVAFIGAIVVNFLIGLLLAPIFALTA
jgi:hypothetical protein